MLVLGLGLESQVLVNLTGGNYRYNTGALKTVN